MQIINRIALGTVQFGLNYGIANRVGKPTNEEIRKVFEFASRVGIKTLDTANAYGNAEEVIGCFGKNEFDVVTKFLPESEKGLLNVQMESSLKNLKTERLYGCMAHRPLDVINHPHLWDELNEYKRQDKTEKIGFSFDDTNELEMVLKAKMFPDIVQVPYNYVDQRFEPFFDQLKSNGCEIHTRSVFLQGLLLMDTEMLSPYFLALKPIISSLQADFGVRLSSALLRFVLENQQIDKVVIGVQNKQQLKQTLDGLIDAPLLKKEQHSVPLHILKPSNWPQ